MGLRDLLSGQTGDTPQIAGGGLRSLLNEGNLASPQTPQDIRQAESPTSFAIPSDFKVDKKSLLSPEAQYRLSQPDSPAAARIRASGQEPIPKQPGFMDSTFANFFKPSTLVQTIKGPGKDFAIDIARSIPRSVLTAALSTVGKVVLPEQDREIRPGEDFGRAGEILLGKEPIKPVGGTGTDFLKGLGVPANEARQFGIPVGIALTAMDLFPSLKGARGLSFTLAKLDDVDSIIKILAKETKMGDDVVRPLAEAVAKITDPAQVEKELVTFAVNPLKYGDNVVKSTAEEIPDFIRRKAVEAGVELPAAEAKKVTQQAVESALVKTADEVDVSALTRVSDDAYKSIVDNGGVTISLEGNVPTKGYAYSPFKDAETVIPKEAFSEKDIDNFIEKNFDRLTEEGNHLGGWVDGDKIYLDISKVGEASPATIKAAEDAGQLAVFDLEKFETINTRLNEKTIRPDINQGQIKGAAEAGIETSTPKIPTGGDEVPDFIKRKLGEIPAGEGGGIGGGGPKSTDPVDTLRAALKQAEVKRPDIESAQSAERARRSAILREIFNKEKGEKAYEEALKTLKGQLLDEKPGFSPLKLSDEAVNGLFQKIWNHAPFEPLTKTAAANGLKALLSGEIPQPKQLVLLEEVFGSDLIQDILEKGAIGKGFWNKAVDVANIPRAMVSSLDFSAPLRQGIFQIPRHPVLAAKDIFKGMKDVFSKETYDAFFDGVKSDPLWQVARDAGLDLPGISKVGGLNAKEEAFKSTLAERIPLLKHLILASERGYTGFLNRFRWDIFKQLYGNFAKDGVVDKKTVKALADFVNVGTGRGKLPGKTLENAASLLNAGFFSPKLMMSRLTLLNPVWYIRQPKAIRMEAMKSWFSLLGTGMTVLYLADLSDAADVELDPRSADFGKIRIGNSRWDIWGGLQQYVVLTSRLISGERKLGSGDIQKLSGDIFNGETRLGILGTFFRSKLAPVPSLAANLLDDQNVVGEDIDPASIAKDNFIPFWIQDVMEGWKEFGPNSLLAIGGPAFFGVGTSTYEPGTTEQAQKKLKQMSLMDPAAAAQEFARIEQEEPKLAKAITRRYRDIARGLTDEDKFLRALSVENRAEEIIDTLRAFDDENEKQNYFKQLVDKGILTENVFKEMQKQLSERNN